MLVAVHVVLERILVAVVVVSRWAQLDTSDYQVLVIDLVANLSWQIQEAKRLIGVVLSELAFTTKLAVSAVRFQSFVVPAVGLYRSLLSCLSPTRHGGERSMGC